MKAQTYLQTLIERQNREGWSDREMARQLMIGNSTWSRIKSGERGMGLSVLQRAMRRFPEYNTIAWFFLDSNVSERNNRDLVKERINAQVP